MGGEGEGCGMGGSWGGGVGGSVRYVGGTYEIKNSRSDLFTMKTNSSCKLLYFTNEATVKVQFSKT